MRWLGANIENTMDIRKLIAKGRVTPIHKTDGEGNLMLVGYERRARSRKAGQQYWLKKPQLIEAAKAPNNRINDK